MRQAELFEVLRKIHREDRVSILLVEQDAALALIVNRGMI